MSSDQKNQQQNEGGNAAGGGGGPALSFKSSFNVEANEFVPGGGASAGYSYYPPQGQGYYPQQSQGTYYQQQGYYQQQSQGGYYNQQQQQQGYYNQQQGQGYYQQRPQQQAYVAPNRQQPQPQQQRAYVAPQKQQQAYVAPNRQVQQQPQQKAYVAPQKSQAAASRPVSAAPAKSISLSASKPAAPAAAKPEEVKPEEKVEEPAETKDLEASVSQMSISEKKEEVHPEKKETPAPSSGKETPVPDEEEEEEEETDEVTPMTEGGKEHVNIIFMGHVDAGKSTMGGHILLLTGMVDKRTMEKYEREAKELGRESWYLSWALDLNQEERNKGKTQEYGRGYFETEKRRFTIIDAPGHKTFVPSMIEGAAQADIGVLVISARRGEFETGFERGGQTREHALLAKTTGVKRLIMVINKMDEPTVNWSKERYDECVNKIMPFLKGVGYGKDDVDVLPVSGYTGANLKDRTSSDVCPWYDGPSLLELLNDMKVERKYNGPLLMPVADKVRDMGVIALGKVESGHVRKGQKVLIMPNRKKTEVTAIFQEDNEVGIAFSGDNVRLRLKGIDEEDLQPGFVICTAKKPIHAVTAFEAEIAIVEYKSIICAGYTAVMHAHTSVEEVTLGALLHHIDKKTRRKSKQPPKFLKQGDMCIARIEMTEVVCLEAYKDYPQLGRFTLRDEGKTVAVGKVTKLILE